MEWAPVKQRRWQAPVYWENIDGEWWLMTSSGMQPLDENEPVCHVSFYEADAYARFRGKRLPTEAEWEYAADCAIRGNFRESGRYHPPAVAEPEGRRIVHGLYRRLRAFRGTAGIDRIEKGRVFFRDRPSVTSNRVMRWLFFGGSQGSSGRAVVC